MKHARLIDSFSQNAFSDVMLSFETSNKRTETKSIFTDAFSKACGEINDASPAFPMGQVFEAGVLREICHLTGSDYSSCVTLAVARTATSEMVSATIIGPNILRTVNRRLQIAGLLITVSRFELAKMVLRETAHLDLSPLQRYEREILQFTISNRYDGGAGSNDCFVALQSIIKVGIPATKIVEAAALAVVWHLKTGEISVDLSDWFIRAAEQVILERTHLSAEASSSWYRAYAMVPAAKQDRAATRAAMESAKHFANEAIRERGPEYATNYLKTYYESSIKEHLYVSRDLDQAIEAGKMLVDLDPMWSESWAELGEVYRKAGKHNDAEQCYQKAVTLGAPYFLMHSYQHSCSLLSLGLVDDALRAMARLVEVDPSNSSAVVMGYKYSRQHNSPLQPFFVRCLDAMTAKLSQSQRDFLSA